MTLDCVVLSFGTKTQTCIHRVTSKFGGDCCKPRQIKPYRVLSRRPAYFFFRASRCVRLSTDLSDGTAAALCVRTSSPVACWHCLNETEEAVGWSKVEMGKEEGARRAE